MPLLTALFIIVALALSHALIDRIRAGRISWGRLLVRLAWLAFGALVALITYAVLVALTT